MRTNATSPPRPSQDAPPPSPVVGEAVRRLRKQKGMTLQALAEASGVSLGMLSQVERGRSNPSVRVLSAIRVALDASLADLFDEGPAPGGDPDFVRRSGRRATIDLGVVRKELLSTNGAHHLQLMILHIAPNGSSGEQPLTYAAEKAGVVLRGELLLRVGENETVLNEGDSFAFDGVNPHSFVNVGASQAQVLWVIGPTALDRHI